jgi:RimJ/RimL family protein N-acetyltransferase
MLSLKPLTLRDIPQILHWNMGTDADWLYQWEGKGYAWPLTAAQVCERMSGESRLFRIDDDGEMVGTIELAGFVARNRSASVCRFLVARSHRDRGVGCRALHLLSDQAHSQFGLTSLDLRVFDFNAAAIACYRKAGFCEMNRLPNAWRNASRDCSVLIMSRELGP